VRNQALDVDELRAALVGVVAELEVVERTGSTNADLLVAARAGAPDRRVLVAERQDAGRGRLDRRWLSPPGVGLTFSVLLRPRGVAPERLGWLPLLAGVALVDTVRGLTGLDAALKWPNDLLVGPGRAKCAGLLAEVAAPDAVVVGIGLNVASTAGQLPPGVAATSLRLEGADVARADVLVALLRRLIADERDWRAVDGDADLCGLRDRYRAACATLRSAVRIDQPGAERIVGTAVDVDHAGRLVVRAESGATRAVAAGDVVHLRALP
jgi:BirA family biotin operon repressor/biotin-[acetyl-CoA-carboxylase] ligase